MSVWTVIATLAAGGVGAGARYILDAVVMHGRSGRFPLGILLVNISGSLALGVLTAVLAGSPSATIVGVGLLGGYTTFSTVSVETALFAQRGQWRRAMLDAAGTLVVCVAAAGVGLLVGGALHG